MYFKYFFLCRFDLQHFTMRFNGIHMCIVFGTILVVTEAIFVSRQNGHLGPKGLEDEYRNDIDLRKRSFSVRGDLRALARMLDFRQIKRRQKSVNPSHKQLIDLGKRNGEDDSSDVTYSTEDDGRAYLSLLKRGRLSINGALQSLSEMLASSGRSRLSEEVSSNKNRLLGLGK